jgi:hypothetical protein
LKEGIGLTEEIYIFDIDGCIMPPIISNLDENKRSREQNVNEIVSRGHKIKLFPEFVDYFQKRCKDAKLVIFLTGRKKSEFGKLTKSHLKTLNTIRRHRIIFYPERNSHKPDEYFEWKIRNIRALININGKHQNKGKKKKLLFKIFDDMDGYFAELKELSKNMGAKLEFYAIDGKTNWGSLRN